MYEGTTGSHHLPIDADIITTDGDKIGNVKEVRGSFFKVNAAGQPDYWLPVTCVASSAGTAVMLNFHKDHLGDFKTNEPLAA
jgi:hypothetical protein